MRVMIYHLKDLYRQISILSILYSKLNDEDGPAEIM